MKELPIYDSDIPLFTEFDPAWIPYQQKVITDIKANYDYDLGLHQILLSGSIGSAKSILGAHLAISHCLENTHAYLGIGRLTMPDLKETLMQMILDHLGEPGEIVNYVHNEQKCKITFTDSKSVIRGFSWSDKKYKKFRSYPFSSFIIEELTENDDPEFYEAIVMRLGRSRRIKEKFLLSMTNPDDPEHWAHRKLIAKKRENIHVYYSKTKENPFLADTYYDSVAENLDPQMALRMLEGLWVSIASKTIYYNYSEKYNFHDWEYKPDLSLPIHISFDFNIGEGKPMSCVLSQFNGAFHWFEEAVIEGARTEDIMEDLGGRGLLNYNTKYIINGDATGKHRDTRGNRSDYDIIEKFMANFERPDGLGLIFEMDIPLSNPPVRSRHNLMNGLFMNVKKQTRAYVYKGAATLHEGLKLTKLKKGGQYIEDDSKSYQHITTAAGYNACTVIKRQGKNSKKQGSVQL